MSIKTFAVLAFLALFVGALNEGYGTHRVTVTEDWPVPERSGGDASSVPITLSTVTSAGGSTSYTINVEGDHTHTLSNPIQP